MTEEQILVEIKAELVAIKEQLQQINNTLQNDRSNMWKILALVIMGAFALVGIKLMLP